MPTHIQLNNLSIGYKQKVVAEGINTDLDGSVLTCLLGANGTGKSTLLRTITAFQKPLAGEVYINGKVIHTLSPEERARLMSIVLTERATVEGMTVEEMVGMGRTPYTGFWGRLSEEDKRIIAEAMSLVGIDSLASRQTSTLSDGERQKVMIAKALAQQTPVILLDEPTAFLDYPSKVETMQLLRNLCHNHGKTILLSTHDVEIALQMADNIWLMEKGRDNVMSIGSPTQLAENGTIARFLEHEGVHFNSDTLTIRIS